MELSLGKELASLHRMRAKELRVRYAEVFGEDAFTANREWLLRRIAWRLQVLAEGDLSERARQRAAELANDADLRLSPPAKPRTLPMSAEPIQSTPAPLQGDSRLPAPGTVITRDYKGQTLQVKVLAKGFEFEGQVYRSLSAVAKAITGSHCNGFLFFRLTKEGEQQ